jgi:hypothetical protein
MTTVRICDRCGIIAPSLHQVFEVSPDGRDDGKELCSDCRRILDGIIRAECATLARIQKINRDAFWGRTTPTLRWNQ